MIPAAHIRRFSFAATVLLSAATLAAQMHGGGGMSNSGPPEGPTAGAPGTPGAPGMPGSTGNVPEQNSPENMATQEFLRNTLDNDQDQIRLSQLAEQKSTSPDVQQFSQQMVKIHGQLDAQLQPLAKQLGVDIPKGPSKKEKKEIDKLQVLSGPDFETAYLENMGQVQRKSLKQFQDEVRNCHNPSLRDAASQDTTALTQNYQMLQKIAQAHNVSIESEKEK